MKKIISISVIFFITINIFAQKKTKRWANERFSLGIISYTNTPVINDDLGLKLSLSTRLLRFISIESNLCSDTKEIYGEENFKIYPIPKTYLRSIGFMKKTIQRRFYTYLNTSINTYKEIGVGFGVGFNINNKWRTEIRLYNKTKNQKIMVNPYFGFGFFRNLNFREYPPKISAKY